MANLVAQTLPEQTAPATNLVIRQVANSTDSSGQPEKDTEKAENPTANGETKDLEPNGAKAPKRELVRQTSFEERLDALVNNLDLSEAQVSSLRLYMHGKEGSVPNLSVCLMPLVGCLYRISRSLFLFP